MWPDATTSTGQSCTLLVVARLFGADPRSAWSDELQMLAAEFEHYKADDADRLDRAKRYREEIEATRDHRRQMQFDDRRDYGRRVNRATNQGRQRHSFRFPLAQALTVKHAYRIAGRMPDAYVDKREETQLEEWRSQVMEQIWWGVTHASQGEAQFGDAAWDGSQIGAASFEVYLDPSTLQVPRYCAVDTGALIVVPGLADPHEFQRIYRWWDVPLRSFILSYQDKQFRDVDIRVGDVQCNNSQPVVTIVECCDSKRKIRFALGSKPGSHPVALEEWTHNYGFVPNVVIPNVGPYRKIWGWSDYDFIREISYYINQVFGQQADVLRQVANGAMTLKGSKLSPTLAKKLLEEGGVLPLGREGELDPVEVPQVPAFATDHLERSFDLMERLGFAPPAAWGAIGAQSGSDRGLQLQPLYELTSMKQKNWNAGLSRLASFIYRIIEQVDAPKSSYTGFQRRGAKVSPFSLLLGSKAQPPAAEGVEDLGQRLPTTPKEIFDGRYDARFEFADRVDYDDPAYVASELNKFAQGAQSLQTTLSRLGIRAPEDEIKLIADEAEKYPWLRQGMIKLIEMQLSADQQGANDGSQNAPSPADAATGALDTMSGSGTSALDTDAGFGALPGGGVGVPYGGA